MKILHPSIAKRHGLSRHSSHGLRLSPSPVIDTPISTLYPSIRTYTPTLDHQFVPIDPFPLSSTGKMTVLVMLFVVAAFVGRGLKRYDIQSHKQNLHKQQSIVVKLISRVSRRIAKGLAQIVASILALVQQRKKPVENPTNEPRKKMLNSANPWQVCTLQRKEILNDRFMLYKFKRNDSSSNFRIGQKVILCSVDESGNPMKEEFYPVLVKMDKHYFGVVSRIFKRSHDDKLSHLLPSLTYGDEVAVKYGENVLNYKGSENPIKHLTIVASGVGIIPVLDIVKRILGDSDYEIEGCELLWINDSEEDFIFNKEVEKLEQLYPNQFSCARVLDHAVTDKDSILDVRVENALPFSEPGRVALVAAPHTVAQKFKPVLDALVYPPQNVISIPVH